MKNLKLFIVIIVTSGMVLLYQNCAPAWDSSQAGEESLLDTDAAPPVTPSPDGLFPNYTKLVMTPNFRLLSNREIKNSLTTIIGQTLPSFEKLPHSSYDPFDNDADVLAPNISLTEFLLNFSSDFSKEFTASQKLMNQFYICQNGTSAKKCTSDFITKIGLIFFRRPVTTLELSDYLNLIEKLVPDFNKIKAVQIVLETMVQDPAFLYKWETGSSIATQQSGVTFYNLNLYEYISRISYFLTGSGPSEQVLIDIKNGKYNSNQALADYIKTTQQTDSYKSNMMNFFGYWLGFAGLSNNTNKKSIEYRMFQESSNLVWDSIFKGNKDWSRVLNSRRTYINKQLADIYGFSMSDSSDAFSWINYPRDDQMGYLAHLSFLSDWERRDDTSTTQRGYHLFKRLFCGSKQPVPAGVDVDEEPGGDLATPCKIKKVEGSILKSGTSCARCHSNMDPIAFGLENYGLDGRYRTTQPNEPSCQIRGEGYVKAVDQSFQGIRGLVELGFKSEAFQACMAEHLIEYGIGQTIYKNNISIISKAVQIQRESKNFENLIEKILLSNEFRYSTRGL